MADQHADPQPHAETDCHTDRTAEHYSDTHPLHVAHSDTFAHTLADSHAAHPYSHLDTLADRHPHAGHADYHTLANTDQETIKQINQAPIAMAISAARQALLRSKPRLASRLVPPVSTLTLSSRKGVTC